MDETREWWNATAEYFQDEANVEVEIHYGPNCPTDETLGLFDSSLEGKDVIELGCGGGQASIGFAKRGANVTGVDLSDEQLEFAKDLIEEHGLSDTISLVHDDITILDKISDSSYDIAFSSFVSQWIEDLDGWFRQTNRVLKEDGRFVLACPHPFFRVLNDSGEPGESYFNTGERIRESDGINPRQILYRRKVSEISNSLVKNNLKIEQIIEPDTRPDDDFSPKFNFQPEPMEYIPTTIIFDCSVDN